MNRSQSKIRHIQQSNVLLEQKRFELMEDLKKTNMIFMGSTPNTNNEWTSGDGFFNVSRKSDGIVGGVTNYWDGGNGASSENEFTMAEQIGIPGNGGDLNTSVAFNYVTTLKAGNALSIKFNAKSSNGDNVSSETYSTRGPVSVDTIYNGRFTLINLPENSNVTITVNGDNVNKLEIKTIKK